jgi:nucleotide-binding universal stress UspA family protein
MKTFKNILAPTDLSPESLDVVKYAAHLAEAQGAALTVLHVVHTTSIVYAGFVPSVDLSGIEEDLVKASREKLDAWVKKNLKRVKSVDVLVHIGLADEVIEKVAKQIDASVVVMATHGYRGFKRALLGSVTEWFVRRSPCPVLVVRPPKRAKTTRTKASRKKTKTA